MWRRGRERRRVHPAAETGPPPPLTRREPVTESAGTMSTDTLEHRNNVRRVDAERREHERQMQPSFSRRTVLPAREVYTDVHNMYARAAAGPPINQPSPDPLLEHRHYLSPHPAAAAAASTRGSLPGQVASPDDSPGHYVSPHPVRAVNLDISDDATGYTHGVHRTPPSLGRLDIHKPAIYRTVYAFPTPERVDSLYNSGEYGEVIAAGEASASPETYEEVYRRVTAPRYETPVVAGSIQHHAAAAAVVAAAAASPDDAYEPVERRRGGQPTVTSTPAHHPVQRRTPPRTEWLSPEFHVGGGRAVTGYRTSPGTMNRGRNLPRRPGDLDTSHREPLLDDRSPLNRRLTMSSPDYEPIGDGN